MPEYLAITLTDWNDINQYFKEDWEYVDCKIEDKRGVIYYHFVLAKGLTNQALKIVKMN